MEILVFKFEGTISNNEENKMFSAPLGRPWQKIYFKIKISLIYMEILVLKFQRPISNDKKIKCLPPPPWDAPGKNIFFIFSF